MMTLHREAKRGGFAAVLVTAFAFVGCGGRANAGEDAGVAGEHSLANQDSPGGSPTRSTPGGSATADVPASNTPGGTTNVGGSNGGVGGGLPDGLTACPADKSFAFASAQVSDASGISEEATQGKVRVTVTKLELLRPAETEAPAELTARHLVLHGAAQDWTLEATIPGLSSELIKEGDELDFQLETSLGYIPLSRAINQAFGLFSPDGELLMFAAQTVGRAPTPDLSFVGLDVSDAGVWCGLGFGCEYEAHTARFSAAGVELDVRPGHTGPLGDLLIGVQDYQTVISNSGNCDDSGRSFMFGVREPARGAK
jgi:hypothetical protein